MGLNNIEKRSIGHSILKAKMKFWHNFIYYRKYTVIGKDKIPTNKPIIFTPNHQNALMDALALLFSTHIQVIFLARADIFKNKTLANILYFLKILPIYRERDGSDFKEKSDKIFSRTIDIITSGSAIGILPEGNHSRIRRLRTLKKGFARIAFQTEEANNFELDIHIVPVGVDYDSFSKYRSSLVISFGDPIPVCDYKDAYKENPAIALNQLKEKLSSNMVKLIPNIKSEEFYDMYNELRVMYRSRMAKKLGIDALDERNRVLSDQKTIEKIESFEEGSPDDIDILNTKVQRFTELKIKLHQTNRILEASGSCLFSLLLGTLSLLGTLPVFVYGIINNIIPYWLPMWVTTKVKDEQFISSIKFVLSAFTFSIFYVVQTLVVYAITQNLSIGLIYLLSLPITGILAWKWTRLYMWIKCSWSYKVLRFIKDKSMLSLITLYDEIISKTDEITG